MVAGVAIVALSGWSSHCQVKSLETKMKSLSASTSSPTDRERSSVLPPVVVRAPVVEPAPEPEPEVRRPSELECELLIHSRHERMLARSTKPARERAAYESWLSEVKKAKKSFDNIPVSAEIDRLWGIYLTIKNTEHATMALAFLDAGYPACLILEALESFPAWDKDKHALYKVWVEMLERDLKDRKWNSSESRTQWSDACKIALWSTSPRCAALGNWGYVPNSEQTRDVLTWVKADYTAHEKWMKGHP
jgi:hypothetical protein